MSEIHTSDEDLKAVVSNAVDESVARAFKRYGGPGRRRGIGIKGVLLLIVLVVACIFGVKGY